MFHSKARSKRPHLAQSQGQAVVAGIWICRYRFPEFSRGSSLIRRPAPGARCGYHAWNPWPIGGDNKLVKLAKGL